MELVMKYTCVVWDFNGTMFDDVNAGIVSTNKMLKERGIPTIPSVEYYKEVFDFPIKEYYRVLGFDFEREPYEVLAPIWVDLYNENAESAGLCPGVAETMERIHEMGIRQVIISACEINMLEHYLAKLGVRKYLDDVVGLDNIHAGGKLGLARDWKAKNGDERLIMIGDTEHDSETAACLMADCVLYAGGHHSRARLERHGHPVIDDIRELIKYL